MKGFFFKYHDVPLIDNIKKLNVKVLDVNIIRFIKNILNLKIYLY